MPQTDQYSVALLHFDNNAVTDSIGTYTWSQNGTNNVGSINSKFGNALICGGSNTIYSTISLGGQSFTIDCWVYYITGGSRRVWSFGGTTYANVEGASGYFRPHFSGTGTTTNTNYSNGWHHLAYVYNYEQDIMYFFVDGIKKVETSKNGLSYFYQSSIESTFSIGGEQNSDIMTGFIDEFHISNGCCRWTNNFTPPAEPWGQGGAAPIVDMSPKDYMHCYKNGTVYNIPLYDYSIGDKCISIRKDANTIYYTPLVSTTVSAKSPIRVIKNGTTYALKNEVL